MEAHVKTVREILISGDQFLVPFFQRQYSWKKKEWDNLYHDVMSLIDSQEDDRKPDLSVSRTATRKLKAGHFADPAASC